MFFCVWGGGEVPFKQYPLKLNLTQYEEDIVVILSGKVLNSDHLLFLAFLKRSPSFKNRVEWYLHDFTQTKV